MPEENENEVLEESTDPTEPEITENDNNEEEDDDMSTPNPLGKLKRSALIHYLATEFDFTSATPTTATAATWYKIGKHVADMSVELNSDTEKIKNILDENEVIDNGYEPEFDVDTYYATPTDGAIYTKLKAIAMERQTGDACRTYVLEVIVDTDGTTFDAWVEEAIVKPTSYGGPQGGVSIPYKVSFAGNRVKGTVTFSNGVPTFAVSA